MVVSYLLFAYSTVIGFSGDIGKLSSSAIPFITVAKGVIGAAAFFAFLAGMTSTLGALIAGTNSQARLIFNAGREGLLPSFIGKVHATKRTPVNSLLFFLSGTLLIIGIWGLGHLLGGHGASAGMSAGNLFFESSTFGTILILLVYGLSNLALPFYYKKHHPDLFNPFRHAVLPILGLITILVPLYYLAKPGQPTPYNWYPYMALATVILAVVYAAVLVKRDPSIGDRIGSIVADE